MTNTLSLDLTKEVPLLHDPVNWVIHAAGKAHTLPRNKREEEEFFQCNVRGTENLFRGLERSAQLPRGIVFISSVAVYGVDSGTDIVESKPLHGNSAYSESKIVAETVAKDWGSKHNVNVAILRLPLVAGPHPPGNLGAMIRAIRKGYYFRINQGIARRSVVLASDLGSILPQALAHGGTYNLTDGLHPTFFELEELIRSQIGKRKILNISTRGAKLLATAGDGINLIFPGKSPFDSEKFRKITNSLTFSDTAAREKLNWQPTPVIHGWKIE